MASQATTGFGGAYPGMMFDCILAKGRNEDGLGVLS